MSQVQGGRWDTLLRRLFPVTGATVATQIAPEIVPVVMTQEMTPEMYYLRGERLGLGWTIRAAAVGVFSYVHLENPANSGKLVIVEAIQVDCLPAGVQQGVYLDWVTPASGQTNTGTIARDTRWGFPVLGPASERTVARIYTTAPAAPIGSTMMYGVTGPLGDPTMLQGLPLILQPNVQIGVRPWVQDCAVTVLYRWRERAYEPGEK